MNKNLKSHIPVLCLVIFLCLSACSDKKNLLAQYKEESASYGKRLAANPSDSKLRLEAARFFYDFRDYNEVISVISSLQEKEARAILAKTYTHLQDYTKAIEIFESLGELEDNEYLYLYAQTLEAQNLFPKAIQLYQKVKAPLQERAQERLNKMGIRIDNGIPAELSQVLKGAENFIKSIDKEEAVTVLVDETYTIHDNNTSVMSIHVIQKVLKEKGKGLAEVEIGYDSTYQRVELEYARTITPDEKVVYAGNEHIRDVSKYMNFPLYSNAKAFIISMPSVEVGALIEYKAKIYSSKLDTPKDFSTLYPLKDRFPIADAHFNLVVPKDKEISLKIVNARYAQGFDLQPNRINTPQSTRFEWKFKNIPAIIPEDGMPNFSDINPAIKITSFKQWQEIFEWWSGLYKDKVSLSDETKNFVKTLTKECHSDIEKAKKIYEFCAKDIRYVGVEYGVSGYEPHKAEQVFLNRYGDCKDKAILLVAMLREAGLKAYPVLIPTRETFALSQDLPTVNFNHAITALDLQGSLIFMDATAQTVTFGDLPLDDQERKVLVFFDEGFRLVDTPQIKENEIKFTLDVDIDEKENARITRTLAPLGYFASSYRYYLRYTHPQKIKDDIQKKMLSISPFSKLLDYKIDNVDTLDTPPQLTYTFITKKFLNPTRNLRVLPNLSDISISSGYVGKDSRLYPIEFEALTRQSFRMKVKLPNNLKVKYIPPDQELDTPWFHYKVAITQGVNSLDFYQEFAIKKRVVDTAEYTAFKQQLEEVAYLLREAIILEQNEKENKEKRP